MRSLLKISLAVLALGVLVFAGSAYAQDKPTYSLTGNIAAAFGSDSIDKTSAASGAANSTKAYSEYATAWETNLRFTFQTDQLQSIARLRIRGFDNGTTNQGAGASAFAGGNANDVYIEQWWTPGAFKLGIGKFQGQDWSAPAAGDYLLLSPIGGDSVYWMIWTGVSGLDAEYNLGAVQVGVALSATCKPSCNKAFPASTIATTFIQENNTSTTVPHIVAKFGDITIRGQFPQTSGDLRSTNSTNSKTVTGSGYQVGVIWAGPGGLRLAADSSSFTDGKQAVLAEAKDRAREGAAVRADIPAGPGIFNVAYFSLSDNNYGANAGAKTFTSTETTLRYIIPVSFGQLIPEYRQVVVGGAIPSTSKGGTPSDATNSSIRLAINSSF